VTRYLLDSHALFWSLMDHPRLSETARRIIASEEDAVFVSGASLYELMFKARRGRLPSALLRLPEAIVSGGYARLPITDDHLQAAALLDWDHGDPWDRILLAQASLEDMRLISIDAVFDAQTDRRVW
jgi:PIN domain nuclease of toxin-antitoxin system